MKLLLLFFPIMVFAKDYPKDVTSFPYDGKRGDFLVGVLGGTGCYRHWDVLDTHDAHHQDPFDKCGPFNMVSLRYHKWVDMREYADTSWKLLAYPIKGDGVLVKADCLIKAKPVYKLIQHEECGDKGKVIAVCYQDGTDASKEKYNCEL